ncbi:IPT/TIG domain-containing protein [Dyadobacter sp. CY356]|uniref:IPT/TIG domain-containing protein n=1 Tax=Dyadobacter sp. CY356 TaxID=2906442 RepID=UPI001F1585A6|nr:IPT/TIG domain-containing protein [Dyadobacter sp. CY356]
MRKITNKRFFTILCLIMFVGVFTACKENDVAATDEVQLLSFGPSGVKPGEQISFIGTNLDKVTAIELKNATVPSSAFVKQSSELIVLVVPTETSEGTVTLKTPAGDIVSKTILSFEVAVKIESVPESARPGENITIKGQYLNWIKEVRFAKDTAVIQFVSQTLNELVVTVPFGAQTGPLIFSAGGTEPLTIETEKDLVIALPTVKSIAPNPAEREKELTITGTNLDLVQGVLLKGLTAPVTEFVSKTATQLVLKIPKTANKGIVTLVAYSGITIESADALKFVGDLPDLAPLKYAIYEDAIMNGWSNWGWGSTADFASTDNVRDGNDAAKLTFTGAWGALKFAGASVATASYSEITFSVFGLPGTEGKKLNVVANTGSPFVIILKEGVWTEYKLSKSDLGNPATITELMFQETGWSGSVYLDHIGLR